MLTKTSSQNSRQSPKFDLFFGAWTTISSREHIYDLNWIEQVILLLLFLQINLFDFFLRERQRERKREKGWESINEYLLLKNCYNIFLKKCESFVEMAYVIANRNRDCDILSLLHSLAGESHALKIHAWLHTNMANSMFRSSNMHSIAVVFEPNVCFSAVWLLSANPSDSSRSSYAVIYDDCKWINAFEPIEVDMGVGASHDINFGSNHEKVRSDRLTNKSFPINFKAFAFLFFCCINRLCNFFFLGKRFQVFAILAARLHHRAAVSFYRSTEHYIKANKRQFCTVIQWMWHSL